MADSADYRGITHRGRIDGTARSLSTMPATIIDIAIVAVVPIGAVVATFLYGRKHQRWTRERRSTADADRPSGHRH